MTAKLPRLRYNSGSGNVDIDFTAVLRDDDEFDQRFNRVQVEKGNGSLQTNHNFNSESLKATFQFVEPSTKDAVKTMVDTWASLGEEFTFFPDQTDLGTSFDVKLTGSGVDYRIQFPGVNLFIFTLALRKVIT